MMLNRGLRASAGTLFCAALVLSATLGLQTTAQAQSEDGPILGHTIVGDGPDNVLVLHDWMGNARNYDAIIPHLDTDAFTYVFADVRGYGKSIDLAGDYTVGEVAGDAFRLVDELGWDRFFLVGHSMTGMVVQRMAIDDWVSERKRLQAVVALTPVPATGVQFDEETIGFVTAVIHNAELTPQYAAVVTGGHATTAFSAAMAHRQIEENNAEAMEGYRVMWMDTDFSTEAAAAQTGTPIRVIGGRLDIPFYSEDAYAQTLGAWFPNAEFRYIADAGHLIMIEAPVYTAFLLEEFLIQNR
ncbi:MAG: alpha/beta fold hydrolase [Alphaproteobacteria bacterium]